MSQNLLFKTQIILSLSLFTQNIKSDQVPATHTAGTSGIKPNKRIVHTIRRSNDSTVVIGTAVVYDLACGSYIAETDCLQDVRCGACIGRTKHFICVTGNQIQPLSDIPNANCNKQVYDLNDPLAISKSIVSKNQKGGAFDDSKLMGMGNKDDKFYNKIKEFKRAVEINELNQGNGQNLGTGEQPSESTKPV